MELKLEKNWTAIQGQTEKLVDSDVFAPAGKVVDLATTERGQLLEDAFEVRNATTGNKEEIEDLEKEKEAVEEQLSELHDSEEDEMTDETSDRIDILDNRLDEINETLDELNENGYQLDEVQEYWIVSIRLANFLAENNEVIIDFENFFVWGRQCSGQHMKLDHVIQQAAKKFGYLYDVAIRDDYSKQIILLWEKNLPDYVVSIIKDAAKKTVDTNNGTIYLVEEVLPLLESMNNQSEKAYFPEWIAAFKRQVTLKGIVAIEVLNA